MTYLSSYLAQNLWPIAHPEWDWGFCLGHIFDSDICTSKNIYLNMWMFIFWRDPLKIESLCSNFMKDFLFTNKGTIISNLTTFQALWGVSIEKRTFIYLLIELFDLWWYPICLKQNPKSYLGSVIGLRFWVKKDDMPWSWHIGPFYFFFTRSVKILLLVT